MNEFRNKAAINLKSVRTILGFTGLFGFYNCIFDKKYKGTSDLIFWVNGPFNLHNIILLPTTSEKLLQTGEEWTFNYFESMYPMNTRIEAEMVKWQDFNFGKYKKSKQE